MSYKFTKPNIYDITKLCVLIYKNLLRPNFKEIPGTKIQKHNNRSLFGAIIRSIKKRLSQILSRK